VLVFDKYMINPYEISVVDASLDNQPDFVVAMKNKHYTIKNLPGASYRLINHWESLGLLDDCRCKQGTGWRYFSLEDMMLIRIFETMRSFGMNTEQMLKTKECLFLEPQGTVNKFSILDGIIFKMVAHGEKGHLHLIIDTDGIAVPMSLKSIDDSREMHLFPTHYISIDLNVLFYSCMKPVEKYIRRPEIKQGKLTHIEKTIIDELRTRQNEKLTIEADENGLPKYMVTEQVKNVKGMSRNKLRDINTQFGEMNVAFADGKPVSVRVKRRKKL